MRICYIGKHGGQGNDDEGAISYSLEKLGHEVIRVEESVALEARHISADLTLCHHIRDYRAIEMAPSPKVFWCFDLIHWESSVEMLVQRHFNRTVWARKMVQLCDLGFFTDGDWVSHDNTGKAHWLPQGADPRPITEWPGSKDNKWDVLFVGTLGYGREEWKKELVERYGDKFRHIYKNCFGSHLHHEIGCSKVVVAPDTPITPCYWSNRIYNTIRAGGFLIHPHTPYLEDQLGNQVEWYHDRAQMFRLIDYFCDVTPDARARHVKTTRDFVMANHTYINRCERLLKVVKERT